MYKIVHYLVVVGYTEFGVVQVPQVPLFYYVLVHGTEFQVPLIKPYQKRSSFHPHNWKWLWILLSCFPRSLEHLSLGKGHQESWFECAWPQFLPCTATLPMEGIQDTRKQLRDWFDKFRQLMKTSNQERLTNDFLHYKHAWTKYWKSMAPTTSYKMPLMGTSKGTRMRFNNINLSFFHFNE